MNTPTDFGSLGLSPDLLRVLEDLGYTAATPIQTLAIPPLLSGEDLTGQSKTGSGKTAAFAIPLLERIQLEQRALQALVLCPTRDLCTQVAGEVRRLGRYRPNLQVIVISGGKPLAPQTRALERGVHVVVATPGRLLDHLRRGNLSLDAIRTVVLDEADRMLDMGFHDDIDEILAQTPGTRQTALFSATFPDGVLDLSGRFQRDPRHISVSDKPAPIEQWRHEIGERQRLEALQNVLRSEAPDSAMVFCNTRQSVDALASELKRAGLAADRLHGGMEQLERDMALARFRNGSTRLLVTTDVAARGLDVSGLAAVVNYELPPQPEVYVHRIGRSGRAGEQGLAVSLHTPEEAFRIAAIEAFTGTTIPLRQLQPSGTEMPSPLTPRLQTLCIGGGRKDKIRPGDILGALTGDAGLSANQVGRIEIADRLSYVALDADIAARTLVRLRAGRIKGRRFRVELIR